VGEKQWAVGSGQWADNSHWQPSLAASNCFAIAKQENICLLPSAFCLLPSAFCFLS
jgi:hypothetical protein